MSSHMRQKDIWIKMLAETCRLLLGLVFIFSGLTKAVDPMGFAIKVGEDLSSFGWDSLQSFAVPFAINLAAVEFTLGICMFLGVYRRYASFLTLLMMLFMTPLTLYLALYNPVADCGCFGEALILTNWETFYKNIVLLAAAVIAFVYNQRTLAGYTFKVYWFVATFAYVYCVGFSLRNYWHLPIIDFRPYKVGVNIPVAMSIPEGAPQDEYEYSFIYEKDGVQKRFTLDNVPADDSTWTFVDTESKLIKAGFVPPISDFIVTTFDGEDRTEQLLADTTGVFLLVSPRLEQANEERIDEINNLYDYATEKGMQFYCLTGSDEAAVTKWIDYTGAEYPFLFVDDVTLKTMIRSNPGLIVLKEGTIMGKWHYNDFPKEEDLDKFVESALLKPMKDEKEARLVTNLLTFAVPLLLVWLYDYRRNRKKQKQPVSENL